MHSHLVLTIKSASELILKPFDTFATLLKRLMSKIDKIASGLHLTVKCQCRLDIA